MLRNALLLVVVMVGVGVLSGALSYLRVESLATTEEIASKGLERIRIDRITFYGIFMPILVILITYILYGFLNGRAPDTAKTTLFLTAIAVAAVFEVLAALVFNIRGFPELTALHVVFAGSFGRLLPQLLG